jgi:para-nitrobenzyl esterase
MLASYRRAAESAMLAVLSHMRSVTGGLLALAALAAATPRQMPVRVTIDAGVVEGARDPSHSEVVAFKGIPYAAPPVDAWRWRPPRPPVAWTGVRAARELGPVCPQSDRLPLVMKRLVTALGGDPSTVRPLGAMSEDCLSINVWTSNIGATKRPVMVWLHGGALSFGSGSDEAAALVPAGVVVVTVNYRLGLLGALAHPALADESPDDSSGNYGLLDQIEALRWVQRNISAFGGDPRRVTVFGHSSGGASVLQLLASPLARGLFHRAVAQSSGLGESLPRREAEAKGLEIASRLGVPAEKPLAGLRALGPDRLVSIGGGPFDRVTDGWVLPEPVPWALEARGDRVPLLIGATANEAVIFQLPHDLKNYQSMLQESGPAWQERLRSLYPAATDEQAGPATTRLMTERDFICAARYVAARRAGPTWLYLVSAPPASGPPGARLGAYHGADVRFLFNLEFGVPLGDAGRRVGDAMRGYWLRFAATGDPNGADLPTWPAYTASERRHLDLAQTVGADTGLGGARCELFDEIWARAQAPPGSETPR